jgi:hypothetical protein
VDQQEGNGGNKRKQEIFLITRVPRLVSDIGMIRLKIACHVGIVEAPVVSRQAPIDHELFSDKSRSHRDKNTRGQKHRQ